MDDKLAITTDHFLGHKLKICQPKTGYRAGVDPVLLAASIPAEANQSVLELGCGVGIASLCLKTRVRNVKVTGVEIQEKYAKIARLNSQFNNLQLEILNCDIANLPIKEKNQVFDHVVLNPPFNTDLKDYEAVNIEKRLSKIENKPNLSGWLDIAISRCKPRGELVLIHRAERLPEILNSLSSRVGDIKVLPLASFKNQKAKRILIKGCKGSNGPLVLLPPLIMHKKVGSFRFETYYSKKMEKVLRKGKALNF